MQETSVEQLIYSSVAAESLDAGDLFKLVETALHRNSVEGITGRLVLADGRFFQAIEGPASAIDGLLTRLRRDPRHHSMVEISRKPIRERQFLRWRMRRMRARDNQAAKREFWRLVSVHGDALSILEGFESYLAFEKASVG